MKSLRNICMLGAGAWGTAVASLLADNGFTVKLWCYESNVAEDIKKNHINRLYWPNIKLSEKIFPFTDVQKAMEDTSFIFESIPVKFLRSVLKQSKNHYFDNQVWVVLSKGIESESLLFPSQMIDELFEKKVKKAIVSGPSFAEGLMLKQVTAVDIASEDEKVLHGLKGILENDYFKTYISADIIGVQVGGALKNIIAIATGILDGAGFSDNTKSYCLTVSLHEIARFAKMLGAEEKTIYGLSGVGDLVLTSMGRLSRNLLIGRKLGLGDKLDEILRENSNVPEGINTVRSIYQILKKQNTRLNIIESVYEIIFENKPVKTLIEALLRSGI